MDQTLDTTVAQLSFSNDPLKLTPTNETESMLGKSFFVALFISVALITFVVVTQIRFLRNIVSKVLPQPGQGTCYQSHHMLLAKLSDLN